MKWDFTNPGLKSGIALVIPLPTALSSYPVSFINPFTAKDAIWCPEVITHMGICLTSIFTCLNIQCVYSEIGTPIGGLWLLG